MLITLGIVLLILGAVFRFLLGTDRVAGVKVQSVGMVLLLIGVVVFLVSFIT